MAVPKKKTSCARKGKRHAGHTHKLYSKTTISCSNCGDHVMPHHACPACGQYKGREIIEIKAEKEVEENE
ncbi:MAG: 50S ribosomal protein L32 [Bacteriovoracaceae bacterium]|nr:50S ribosomal protein L32 [Bacteriovoracaceae bacterium]